MLQRMGQLAEKVKARRAELNLSQVSLGAKIGLADAKSYVSRIENSGLIPNRSRLSDLEQALNFVAGELQDAALFDEQARHAQASA